MVEMMFYRKKLIPVLSVLMCLESVELLLLRIIHSLPMETSMRQPEKL